MASLSTITIDTLQERITSSLESVGYNPSLAIEAQQADKIERIRTLLNRRDHIDSIVDMQVADQRADYGTEQWDADFVCLGNISNEEGLRDSVWKAVRNSRFKRFQQAFSHPDQFVVPAFTVQPRGIITFNHEHDLNTMSLAPCLVSADRIPEKLAEDLKLVEFDASDRGKPQRRLEKKAQPDVARRLKELFENSDTLEAGQRRLLVINDADETLHGTILYTRTEENGDLPNSLTVQHFSSVYAAHRKTLHEGESYRGEISKLTQLCVDIRALNSRLNRDWKRETPQAQKQQMQEEATALMDQYSDVIRACQARHKVRARDLLDQAASFYDSRGKVNVSKSLSQMVGALNELERRFSEMYPKGGYNERDRMALLAALQEQEAILANARKQLEANARILNNGLELFSERDLTGPQIDSQATGAANRIYPDSLDRVRLQPFMVYRKALEDRRGELSTALHDRNPDAAKDAAVKMYVISKYQRVRACVERIREHMADDRSVPLARVRSFVSQMREYIGNRQVLPDHTVEGFTDSFTSVSDRLQGIEERLAEISADDTEAGPNSPLYTDLKAYLDECDLEKIVKELP